MSAITIKDLSESIDLDRKAMLAIVGGSRRGAYRVTLQPQSQSGFKLVNFPGGIGQFQLQPSLSRR